MSNQAEIINKLLINKLLREYLVSDKSNFLTTSCLMSRKLIQEHFQSVFGKLARVEVTPGWEENTFDVAIYALDFTSVEFTVSGRDEVSNLIEEQ